MIHAGMRCSNVGTGAAGAELLRLDLRVPQRTDAAREAVAEVRAVVGFASLLDELGMEARRVAQEPREDVLRRQTQMELRKEPDPQCGKMRDV